MHRLRLVIGLLVFAFGAILAPARANVDPDYRIGPDDVLEITVLNHADLNKVVTVLPDGTFTYPWAGRVQASGRTQREVSAEIRTALEQTLNNVAVSIAVKEVHSRRVRIVGAVRSPNAYDLKPGWRFYDLVAVAGGLSARPARVSGRIVRDGSVIPVNVATASAQPEGDENPTLEPDDLVLLEEADPAGYKVYVMGQVQKPGAFDLGEEGASVLSLLAQAGNPTEKAALTRAYVQRGTEEVPLNLYGMVVEGKPDPVVQAFRFEPGDVLFVPEIDRHFAVMGQVNKPGYYPVPEMKTVTALDALSMAGGQSQTGDLKKAGLIRSVNGQTSVVPLDLEKMLKSGDLGANQIMSANDVLFIPARGEKGFDWKNIVNPLSALSYLGIRLFR